MSMPDNIKYFLYGMIVASGLVKREDKTIDVPITSIQLAYEKTDLRPDENMIITATVFPADATFKDVEWSSSDIDVLAVNKISENTCIIKALQSGSVTVTCKATYPDINGVYATAAVNINVLGNIIFETLSISQLKTGMNDYHIGESALVLEYTPLEASGENISVEINETLGEEETPYSVENTMFDNIKVIKNSFNSLDYNNYISQSNNSYLYYSVRATDGSGLSLLNNSITFLRNGIKESLYGSSQSDVMSKSYNLQVGYSKRLLDNIDLFQCLATPDNVNIEVTSGNECISIDSQYIVTGVSAGTATVKATIANAKEYNITVNVSDSLTDTTSNPGILFVDEYGQSLASNYIGCYTRVNVKFRPVASAKGIKIVSIQLSDSSKGTIENGWVIPTGAGTVEVKVTYKYLNGNTETQYTRTINLYAYSSQISCGTVSSDYLKEGIAVWCTATNSTRYYNELNSQKVDIIFNANEAQLLSQVIFDGSNVNTLTFNRDGVSKRAVNGSGTVRVYQFKKLTTGDVTVRFQSNSHPEVYDEVII